jgi:hypothetical protein
MVIMVKKQTSIFQILAKKRSLIGLLAFSAMFMMVSVLAFDCLISTAKADSAFPVFSLWSTKYKTYYYTTTESKKNKLVSQKWSSKGTPFTAYKTSGDGLVPVYKFWNSKTKKYLFTASQTEKDTLKVQSKKTKWKYQGVAFYEYAADAENLTPVYRFKSTKYNSYFYTTSPGIKTCLMDNTTAENWSYVEISWWAPMEGADLSEATDTCKPVYGPEITVGLWSYSRSDLKDSPFKIEANKDYNVRDEDGKIISTIAASTITKVTYDSDGHLKIYNSISSTLVDHLVSFDAADGNNSSLIFDTHRPGSDYNHYRGKIKLRYSDATDKIWVINALPLEQYVWGDGEIAGTGDADHNKVMTTIYRTYGYWKKLYSTKYATEGFKVTDDSSSQIYRGYDWETGHASINQAAKDTAGKIVTYEGDVALTPYSSWTDGRTRSFEERWGSTDYPWCQSVSDPYGKHPTMTTKQLVDAGNHMVGLSAHGSLHLATEHGWDWQKILKYYFTDIKISSIY